MSGSSNDSALLDTNVVIDYFRKKIDLRSQFKSHDIYLCDIVLGELFGGASKSDRPDKNKQQIEDLIPTINVLVKNIETTRIYGRLWAELARKGRLIPTNDLWIAALGIQHGMKVITRDKHFGNVSGLTIEHWIRC